MTPVERQKLQIERLKNFEKPVYDTLIKCGESQSFTFIYKGNPDEIEGYKVHCKTCTKVKREGNVIIVTFTAGDCSDYSEKRAAGQSRESYTSSVSVYFKDGQPLQHFNDAGEIKENPDKVPVSLQVRAIIEF